MEKDTLRMQFLSGVITESEYKVKLMEFDMNQFSMGNSSSPKASFEDKWNDVPNANKEILKKSTGKEPVKIMASSNGKNYVITKGLDGKFYRYQYTQAENPGKPMGPFNREDEAKKLNESLNESMIGGIVGIGAINQIPPRAKSDYETAFEHFLGKKYGLNEVEEEIPAVDSRIENDANFQNLVNYLKKNPDEAEDVNDELKTLKEDWIKKGKGYSMLDGVDSTYVYFKDNKYYKEQSLPGGSGFGKYKTDEISKEEFQKIQKEYWKDKLVKIGLGATAVGFVGALMSGPLGAMDPGGMLEAALIAAGFGGAAASIFENDDDVKLNENIGSTIDKMLQTFEFSEKGNDEMIEFGNYLLSPEGPKNIARSIKGKLKGEGGENYFTSKPEELDAFLSKLKGDGTISDRIRSKSDYIAGIEDNEEESN